MKEFIRDLGLENINYGYSTGLKNRAGAGEELISYSPADQTPIASTTLCTTTDFEEAIQAAKSAYVQWRNVPAPKRGEIVRQMGEAFRKNKQALGQLVSYEMGKSLQEGLGEVQEIIDICDFAVGLSRQLYGLTMHSERPEHRMYEQYHPLGIVGIISAFNFPVAVWSWNAMIAWVCGNVCIWKPSEKTPLSAIACQNIISSVIESNQLPEGLSTLLIGGPEIGQALSSHEDVALVSATGSTRMGKAVAKTVASRLGKYLLELGGNNSIIVTENADLNLTVPAVVFGAVGTAGQRCTTTRRLIVHQSVKEELTQRLVKAYGQLKIGDPLDPAHHVGPLIDQDAVLNYTNAIEAAVAQGGEILFGGEVLEGNYVLPTIIDMPAQTEIVKHETFAPILYILTYEDWNDAIFLQNDVPQGLSSAVFTQNIREAERFLSANGSDCGIANVNIGTSGAEIGGAFGGEKETGGGRESGSDAWKAYMRRQTNTINYGTTLPLAQGIKFDL
ncbi:Aldehyde Dehydrogenase [Leadbetterella byssophila DSM 17132]|uniref:Aldehyde Dehydrogenase n=1 Tax=Leadbetterella byssophila (strain DSM 17132 / JCM 16389 / KACC 11308 / NBRC 106382 / 4M15) TaxID=649349 RepID=E4RU61_LEAB4|nr:aldehyde dehydrogenase family protein [Leadbetterella byssophila]ADQ16042.1 Aldehyde Dehydrogenase [Leadbetterella byssophila DSM 17132]